MVRSERELLASVADIEAIMKACVSGLWVEGVGTWQNIHSQEYSEDKSNFGGRGKDGHEAQSSAFPSSLFSLTQTPKCP